MDQLEFEHRFNEYHATNAEKYPHLVGWVPVTAAELDQIEEVKGVKLSEGFRSFLTTYGHGKFYFVTLFSPLLERPDLKRPVGSFFTIWEYYTWQQFDGSYLPICSNGDELWTGFKVKDGKCSERLFNFDVDEGDYTAEEYDSIWDFLDETALV